MYKLERGQYATIYGCTRRSVGNYERDDAPLDDPEGMYHWLWNRRTQPAGFTGKSLEEIIAHYRMAADAPPGTDGLAALRTTAMWKELSDLIVDIDEHRRWLILWIEDDKPPLPPGVEARLREVSETILAAMRTLDDLPSGYPELDEEEGEVGDEAESSALATATA